MLRQASFVMCLALVACGGDDGTSTPKDAAAGSDAQAATVMETPCVGGEQTVTTVNGTNAFMPNAITIDQNEAVQFVMSSTHNVAAFPTMSDAGLSVGFGMTKCLKFTAKGMFKFKCLPHGFTGIVTVN